MPWKHFELNKHGWDDVDVFRQQLLSVLWISALSSVHSDGNINETSPYSESWCVYFRANGCITLQLFCWLIILNSSLCVICVEFWLLWPSDTVKGPIMLFSGAQRKDLCKLRAFCLQWPEKEPFRPFFCQMSSQKGLPFIQRLRNTLPLEQKHLQTLEIPKWFVWQNWRFRGFTKSQ